VPEVPLLNFTRHSRIAALACSALAALVLAGCSGDLLNVMPEVASPEAAEVDRLTYLIIYITGITFVGVQLILIWFLFKHRKKPGVVAKHTHGNHTVELIWTVAPAVVLVLLAVYQADLWVRLKSATPKDNADAVKVQIFAKQFEWNFRYPGADGEYGTEDDRVTAGNLVIPINRPINAELRAMDVIHSFFLPNFRFKQDAVPGLRAPLWFRANKLSADREPVMDRNGELQDLDYWDIVCAELCGNQHSSMAGRLFVVPNDTFEQWVSGEKIEGLPPLTPIGPARGTPGKIWERWSWQDSSAIPGPPRWHKNVWGEDDLGEDALSDEDEDEDL